MIMKILIKYGELTKEFENQPSISIGNSSDSDIVISQLADDEAFKLVWAADYGKYILVNVYKNQNILCSNKKFAKILVPKKEVNIKVQSLPFDIIVKDTSMADELVSISSKPASNVNNVEKIAKEAQEFNQISNNPSNIFDCQTEKNRIAIIKEIGFKILEIKNNIKTTERINLILTLSIFVLSVVSSFAVTNFLLGLKIDNTTGAINLTTNFWFLIGVSLVVGAMCIALKYSVSMTLWNKHIKKYTNNTFAQKIIMNVSSIFLLVVYILNLAYYKPISPFSAFLVSLLFVGALCIASVGSGYFYNNIKILKENLTNCEYREDFESVIKQYRNLISIYVNKLSPNKIENIKNTLLNNQLRMIVEFFVGLATAPFLAYGVSNTLASCFPEAASWIRVSGIRFSPIFLVLSTFLILFAFLSFVKAFTIGKQINASQIIKFDGFHNWARHGVNVLGLDSMRSLEKEKQYYFLIGCIIILIEFSMNVSYFITEIGGDIQGMFLSFVTALVPTALLIAETNLLSGTMFNITNCNEVIEALN